MSIQKKSLSVNLYFALFTISGFTGLIYESLWTKYLKNFLGHADYAQVLVLVIFMGGLAAGSALASRFSLKLKHVILAYAVVEVIIGLFALVFHIVFVATTDYAFLTLLPQIGGDGPVNLVKWTMAALLILPQTILLGMTFPFMSSGLIRAYPEKQGKTLSMLYFTNCIGAAIGVLVGGLVLTPLIGLERTIQIGGVLNLLLAAVVFIFWQKFTRTRELESVPIPQNANRNKSLYTTLLLTVAFTGLASFMYEIGWIRMLSMVLGTTTPSFDLMLSAFISGLAIGGFWMRNRIDRLSNPLKTLAIIQVVMGILALMTLVFYNSMFNIMLAILKAAPKTDAGYFYFSLGSQGIAYLIMLPATICAGMTLPLITHILLRDGHGERAIGNVYAANTLGSILGVIITVALVMPFLGLKYVVFLGAVVDIALGLILLAMFTAGWKPELRMAIPAIAAIVLLAVGFGVTLDSNKMASGVYQLSKIRDDRKILFHKDGRSSTINFFRTGDEEVKDKEGKVVSVTPGDYLSISTNGKIEASIDTHSRSKDIPTMVMVGVIPMAMKPDTKSVAIIGIGSGLTTHSLLHFPQLTTVNTIEIEPAMAEAARLFGKYVENTFSDKRHQIHFEDAKVFFTKHQRQYDMIVSEPSQPWVSGVSGLFSKEFYRLVRPYIKDDGLLVQWIHLYSINMDLISSVFKALSPEFSDFAVYALNGVDIAIVAVKQGKVPLPGNDAFKHPGVITQLKPLGVHSAADLNVRFLGNRTILEPLMNSFPLRANSDYHPVLDHQAPKYQFLKESATDFIKLRRLPAFVYETLDPTVKISGGKPIGANRHLDIGPDARLAYDLWRQASSNITLVTREKSEGGDVLKNMVALRIQCDKDSETKLIRSIHAVADTTLPFLDKQQFAQVWNKAHNPACIELHQDLVPWVELYRAIGERNSDAVIKYTQQLLPKGPINQSLRNDYLTLMALTGYLAKKDKQASSELWLRYEKKKKVTKKIKNNKEIEEIVEEMVDHLPLDARLVWAHIDRITPNP